MTRPPLEVIPAILRTTYEELAHDWHAVAETAHHIQIDVTDGIFAGDVSFRDIRRLKQLPLSQKIELHMMVHTPEHFLADIIDLNPARCVFHIESFAGDKNLEFAYEKLREETQSELALAINPASPNDWLEEHLAQIDYIMFMGYNPGWANQPLHAMAYKKVSEFHDRHPQTPIAVDGHVTKETVPLFVEAGATLLCANTAIFGEGNPVENLRQLQLLAEATAHDES